MQKGWDEADAGWSLERFIVLGHTNKTPGDLALGEGSGWRDNLLCSESYQISIK